MSSTTTAATPPPQSGPSPTKIGKSFIKQYYQTLLTNPSQLIRFYQSDSIISRGSSADVAATQGCGDALSSAEPGETVRSQFFEFANSTAENGEETGLSIDFSSGAIDAQESLGGGILLVVTGHMYLPKRTGFVHTFFLSNSAPAGQKKVFYVKNDVLRFLGEDMNEEMVVDTSGDDVGGEHGEMNGEVAAVADVQHEPVAVKELVQDVSASPAVENEEQPFVVCADDREIDYSEPAAEEVKMEIIDNLGVEALNIAEDEPAAEEEKNDIVEDDTPPDSPANSKGSSADSGKKSKRNRRKKGKSSRSNSPSDKTDEKPTEDEATEQDADNKPNTPGSWASLVATGQPKKSGRRSPKSKRDDKPPTNNNHDKKAPQDRATSKPSESNTTTSTNNSANNNNTTSNQRTPEATLFIRNVPSGTSESEMRALFEPVAISTSTKILGITLNPNRGFCFVDFDSVKAVDAAVAEAEKSLVKEPRTGRKVTSSFMAKGRVLDVERKVKDNSKGGGYRGNRGRAGMRRSPVGR